MTRERFIKELGITPTCVGNTEISEDQKMTYEDHPHLCGEHGRRGRVKCNHVGSPPPVWGTRRVVVDVVVTPRITPTCVGNTRLKH